MKMRPPSFNQIIAIFFLALVTGKALPQTDTVHLHKKTHVNAIISGGFITDFAGVGGIGDLTISYGKHVFGLSYESEGIGKVITYSQGTLLTWGYGSGTETSDAADLRQVLALHYGRQLSKAISITGGIAWVIRSERTAINGHGDSVGDYHADLVEHQNDYIAIPITIKAYLREAFWTGALELHLQLMASTHDLWANAGLSAAFGSFPRNE